MMVLKPEGQKYLKKKKNLKYAQLQIPDVMYRTSTADQQ